MLTKLEKLRKSKKGSILDLIFIAAALTAFGIVMLIGFKFVSEWNTHISANPDIPANAVTATTTLQGYYPGIVDNSFLFLTIGLGVVALILASLVRVHPVFIGLFFVAWIFVVFLSAIFSNIYQEMAASSHLVSQANQLTFAGQVLTFLPFIIGILGIVLMVVMYKTWNNV